VFYKQSNLLKVVFIVKYANYFQNTVRERLKESFKEFKFQSVVTEGLNQIAKNTAKNVDHSSKVPTQGTNYRKAVFLFSNEAIESPRKAHEGEDALVSAMADRNMAEAKLSEFDPRWKEIEDPTIKLALQLGLHPSYLGRPSKEAENAQPLSMLHQILSRDSFLGTCTRNPLHYRRLTFNCLHKLKYKTHTGKLTSN